MLRGLLAPGKDAGGLDDDVAAEVAPGEVGRVAFAEDTKDVAADDEVVALNVDVAGIDAMDGVVLEQVGERVRVGDVVDGDDVEGVEPPF